MRTWSQPLVPRNDWSALDVPALDTYEPRLSVSVVIPAWQAERSLPYVLAGLAAQTYPAELLEVVVVDDGNTAGVELPEVRPGRTRVVRVESGWGRANALNTGAAASGADVLHWLDSDMLLDRDHVRAQLRWHHVVDYAVVLGTKRFVDPAPLWSRTPAEVRDLVAAGRDGEIFADVEHEAHDWVDRMWARSDDLRGAGTRGFRSHVGATASVARDLFTSVGGLDGTLVLGEDMDLGHRLAEAGAVLVPEHAASSWHLGRSTVMGRRDEVNRYNDAALVNLMPGLRSKRHRRGRVYEVPYLEVVVPARGHADEVRGCVDAVLASTLDDLSVALVGPWDQLTDERRSPLGDPLLEARILERTYRHDPRVRLCTQEPERTPRVPHRIVLATTAYAPLGPALQALVEDLERTQHAERRLVDASGDEVAVLRASAAVARALRVGAETEDEVAAALDEAYGRSTLGVTDAGWVPTTERRVARFRGPVEGPWDPAESRAVFDRAVRRGPKVEPAEQAAPAGEPAGEPAAEQGVEAPVRRWWQRRP
ncbi:MAG: glycosyltransferase [Nocardioides sp.]|uniref:glycosyltransferase n=1 Tax=Nocardioides sp. TaxID=35761 RepID=UPI003F09F6F4